MKPRRPLRRTYLARHPKPREHRDQGHGFKDPRSRVLWRTGRVILKGQDKTDLRRAVYNRAGGRCEIERNGKRCNWFAPWDGPGHGELVHRIASSHGGSDSRSQLSVGMPDCHGKRDPPRTAVRRLTADEQRTLARIAKDRRNGFMVSAPDVDFLLEILERSNR